MTPLPDPSPSALLGDATWAELSNLPAGRLILAVPIGSCEQHGAHLPLDTDTRIAEALASGLAAAVPAVLVTPSIGITASGEHQGFAGTLSIGAAALEVMLIELVRSADWATGVVLVNGHGGNSDAIRNAVVVLTGEGRRVIAWWPRIAGGDAHAGRTETSLMLAIAAQSVRHEAMEPGRTEAIDELLPQLRAEGVIAVSPNGVLGDPTGATASEGTELLRVLIDDLVHVVTTWNP